MSAPFVTVLPLGAASPAATAVPHVAALPRAVELPSGVEVSEILADVAADGVAAPDAVVDELLAVVDRAAGHGIDLSIVVLEENPTRDSELRDLATDVGAEEGGTVLVLSPNWVGSYSDSISRVQLESGQDRTYTGGDAVVAADNFVDDLLEPGPPWTLLTVLVLGVVALATAALIRAKLRRGDDAPASSSEGTGDRHVPEDAPSARP
ncbi:hypothetical protein G4H71_21200 [Rhodococcus triatomae]|uniref:TPM domain-containing protein n=1 Tax=Rhodococcus triatomae TaxID=300028 RepID=A0A1G8K9X5_9NOCA|nr:DUF6676 family protein [Rhodococcus triatomae]QNG18861.1 hypothetical protein G4H72_09180 [Rhodococcus triatomae]QNG25227.1 hypothetical protein G4H71_21200 [Rhodococcus triatomae]SDI40193.1 hypothetical protein SAMN05444695_10768 [Rhodococcus triatomae]